MFNVNPVIHISSCVWNSKDEEKMVFVYRMVAMEARMNSELELQKTGKRPTIRPYKCGQCLCCGDSCGCVEVLIHLLNDSF